jgi:sugar-specific transcriptional regulator TrmB
MTTIMLEKILCEIGLNQSEIDIYCLLLQAKQMKASQISQKLRIPRSTIYGHLEKLKNLGLLRETYMHNGTKIFNIYSPEKISLLLEEKYTKIHQYSSEFAEILPSLLKKTDGKSIRPSFELFQGEDQLREALRDMLFNENIHTLAVWPIKNMLDILSPSFFNYLNKIRIKNNLYTRAIWSRNQTVDVSKHPYLGVGNEFRREIRIAPKYIDFEMGYWIYGNKVVFISSLKENFGFAIQSAELANLLSTQFEILWKLSKPMQVDSTQTSQFLRSI